MPAAWNNNTVAAEKPVPFLNTIPAGSGIVFIGVTERMSDHEKTVQYALEDAARQVAVFNQVTGRYAMENVTGTGYFDYSHNTYTDLQYDEEGSIQYVDSLQYDEDTDTLRIDDVFIVRTVYPSALSAPVQYRPTYSGSNGKPNWVTNPAVKIEGYVVGVGYSSSHYSLATTYRNSFNNAIFAIIRSCNTVIHSSNVTHENSASLFGYYTSNENTTYSYGTLSGFYVLDRWYDPKAKTVWTLAIARKAN